MLANDLANAIRNLNIIGAAIRTAFLEADIAIGVAVKTPLDGLTITPEMPGWVKGPISVIARHSDAESGMEMIQTISDALTTLGTPRNLENYKLICFYPTTEPIMFPVNDAGLYEFSVNFECHAVRL